MVLPRRKFKENGAFYNCSWFVDEGTAVVTLEIYITENVGG